jgi:polar amino acid transport system substrate-binding protein
MKLTATLAGLALAAISAVLPHHARADALPDLGGKAITVVTEDAYPPLQFVDPKTGKSIGWEYDAMAEMAKRLNLKVTYQHSSWDAMIPAISQGQYDIGMEGITIRADRAKKVDFSIPYMHSEMLMLVRKGESRFTDAKGFAADKKLLVAAQPGTTPFYTAVYDILDGNEANPRVKLFETFGAGLQALKAGDVDLVLTDSTAGRAIVERNPDTFKIIGKPLGQEDFGFIFPKGSKLEAPINAAIKALKADGSLDKLTKKWFVDYKMGQ